jgi:hypothetical protein
MMAPMQAAPDSKILERVRKLLAIAAEGSGASEAEVQFAASRAAEMMEEHGLAMATIEAHGGEGEVREKKEQTSTFGAWYGPLMEAVCESCFCAAEVRVKSRAYDSTSDSVTGKRLRFNIYGRRSAVASAEVMYEYLRSAIWRLSRETPGLDSQRLFRHGCADRVIARLRARHAKILREQREEAERRAREDAARASHPSAAPTGTALVVTLVDYAQRETDLNEDLRRGVPPGTTERERKERIAKEEAKERRFEELQKEGLSTDVAWDMAHLGWTRERAEEYEQKALETAAAAFERLTKQKPRKERARTYHYHESREDKKRRHPSFRAGQAAGDKVGLDQQIGKSATKKIGE